jgi:hypothetical protein
MKQMREAASSASENLLATTQSEVANVVISGTGETVRIVVRVQSCGRGGRCIHSEAFGQQVIWSDAVIRQGSNQRVLDHEDGCACELDGLEWFVLVFGRHCREHRHLIGRQGATNLICFSAVREPAQ